MIKLRAVDFETTDLEPSKGGIVEVGWTDIHIEETNCEVRGWESQVTNPYCTMNPAARGVHHITDEEIAKGLPVQQVMEQVCDGVDYFVAHYAKFEESWWRFPKPFICTNKLAYRLAPDSPNHQNQTLRYYLNTQAANEEVGQPHRAGPDSYVTAHTFKYFTDRKPDAWNLDTWIQNCLKVSQAPASLPRCPIGKQRGAAWKDIEQGFLVWVVRQPQMEEDIKFSARQELNRRGIHT